MDLYSLLPSIIKEKDRLANEGTGEAETILQKILSCFEQELNITKDQIEGLHDLYDYDACPEQYLPLLNMMLGSTFPASWSVGRRRLFLKSIVYIYHRSGQRITWEAILRLLGHAGFFPWELYKEELYEDFEYYLRPDYYAALRSARVDVRMADETYTFPTGDSYTMLELFRPIHVLYRRSGVRRELGPDAARVHGDWFGGRLGYGVEDYMAMATDSCLVPCETFCEASCEIGSCEGGFEVELSCIAACQSGCESGCEIYCETTCEGTCQAACEGADCQIGCETTCEDHCEQICETYCELYPETGPTCDVPACAGAVCSHFSGWLFTGMTTVNSDAGVLYGEVYTSGGIRWLDIRRSESGINYSLVCFAKLEGSSPVTLTLQQYRARGLEGEVDWDGVYEEGAFVLTCPGAGP